MSAHQAITFTDHDRLIQETPLEIGPWGLATETALPARHVVWVSIALTLVSLAVVAFA